MSALIPIFLQYLPYLVKAAGTIPEILGFIKRTQETLSKDVQWDKAAQDKFDADVETVTSQPHWQKLNDPSVPPGQ